MGKLKDIYQKKREIINYLFFGVLTTAVGWVVYFCMLWGLKFALGIPSDDTASGRYLAVYSVSQVVQWIAAVLFAFFTNRKWVFTDADKDVSLPLQLSKFAGGRVITFFIDYFVTLLVGIGLSALIPALTKILLFGKEWNFAEIGAKLLAAVIVIICNYIFSKLFVFKNKKER